MPRESDEQMIDDLLERLYREGTEHDSLAATRQQMRFNITPATGRFLDLLIQECRPQRILELGTSNGYSTIWIARAATKIGSRTESVDVQLHKSEQAKRNLESAGLSDAVTLHTSEGASFLSEAESDSFDFVFLDSDRGSYVDWWPDLMRVISFGILVVDNAVSHPHEMSEFRKQIDAAESLESVVLPIGKGQLVVRKRD